jgi:peptidoglycan/xylan/chitin deacetylase (PgdA/CDA1 family)
VVVRERTGLAEPLLALTFDDGPSWATARVLDHLAAQGARATFFVVGAAVAGREELLERALREGHELGSHTFSHPHPAKLDDAALREEVRRGAEAAGGPPLVRPPYGEDPERFDRVAAELGLGPTVLWSIDPRDWEETRPDVIAERVLSEAAPGAIVDLHDGERRSPHPTVEALALLLPALAGYRLVTVSALLRA